MSEIKNILSGGPEEQGGKKLSEERMLAYLEGKLSSAEQHEVELWLADAGMESDAMEGLQTLKPDEIRVSVNHLNHHLRTATRKKNRRRKPLKTDQFTWIAIVIILFLVVLAFIIVRKSI
jgi:hypothetical protein